MNKMDQLIDETAKELQKQNMSIENSKAQNKKRTTCRGRYNR